MPTDDSLATASPDLAADALAEGTVPEYLRRVYWWAYLNSFALWLFDQPPVVNGILWGNYRRLIGDAVAEMPVGGHVLQPACVYGEFSQKLAARLGAAGRLDVIDVAPIQVALGQRKLAAFANARVSQCDAVAPPDGPFDGICCFFLLHEVPEDYKRRIVNALLRRVRPGGRVVFVDYHKPHPRHLLRPVMWTVFRLLEPFAPALWQRPIAAYAEAAEEYDWSTKLYFGGLYQKTVALRRSAV